VRNLAAHVEPGSVVAILDNQYAEEAPPRSRDGDAEGNTYQQRRRLANGEEYEV